MHMRAKPICDKSRFSYSCNSVDDHARRAFSEPFIEARNRFDSSMNWSGLRREVWYVACAPAIILVVQAEVNHHPQPASSLNRILYPRMSKLLHVEHEEGFQD